MKYPFRTKPYAHQIQGMRFAFQQFNRGLGAGFFFEPRTGKTKTTIDTWSALYLKRKVRKVLVICPNRVIGTWVKEIQTHSPLINEIVVWDAKERRKGMIRQPAGHADQMIVITNFETFATPGKQLPSGRRSRSTGRFKNREYIQKWLDGDDALIVVDESHKIKNPSGKASNMIVGMRRYFGYQLILTGTPITKARRAADIYMQFRLINPSRFSEWGATYEDFRNHTGKWIEANGFPQWVGEKKRGIEDLHRGIHRDALVIKRDECFDLPARLPDRIIDVPLTTSAKHYDEMAEEMLTKLKNGEIAEASIPLVVSLRLGQITSGFVGIMKPDPRNDEKQISEIHSVGTEKIKALIELLKEETLEKEEPTIIVARWKFDITAIQNACKTLDIPVHTIQGGMSRSSTDEALRVFSQSVGSASVMVVQPQAGGVGLDMRVAGHTIWYSLTPSYVDYTQMKDRNALHPHAVQHTYLISEGTVDRMLYDTLQTDGNFARAIMNRPEGILRPSTKRR